MRRTFRKPLVAFTSKKLLRFRPAASDLSEFGPGVIFNRIYAE
jgi:2-oxoglutarate dehydrogenase complex dehydrogenase (E1) component-like enzyme